MKSSKIIMKKGATLFCVKAKRGQELSEREAFEINVNQVPGFLPFDHSRSGGGFTLTYNLSGLLTLREFLQFNVISERMLKKMLGSIFENLEIASKLYFNRNLIKMTADTVMVNPADWRIYFIYVPIQPFETEGNLKDILKCIVTYATFNPREDTDYIQRYIEILNDGVNFSEFAIKEFVNSLSGRSHNPSITYLEEQFEPDSEPDSNAVGREYSEEIYNPLNENHTAKTGGTVSIYCDYWLCRESDGSKTRIDSPVFHIGKVSGFSDMFVDNRAVSRRHADIIREGDEFYIVDLDSTNGTYLNGVRLESGVKTRLTLGCKLTFANDDFVFYKE